MTTARCSRSAASSFRSFHDDDFLYESFNADLPVATEPELEIGPNGRETTAIDFLFAMVFAAAALGLLSCLGFVVRSRAMCCTARDSYSACEMWQDFRSVLSFTLGALVCCIATRDNKSGHQIGTEGIRKVQLYTCLL